MPFFPLRSWPRCLWLLLFTGLAAPAGEAPVSRPGLLHVDLDSAIRLALAKNYTIQVNQFTPRITREEITRARGSFDPSLELDASRDYHSDRVVLTDGNRTDLNEISRTDVPIDATLSGHTALGTQYRFGWNTSRLTGNGPLELGSVSSGPGLGLTQPVLRGFGPDATLYETRIARTDAQISEWAFRQLVIDTITQLVYVYNDLHFAAEDLRVARSSRELARQLYKDNSQRADIGAMSPLDIIPASAQVAQREEAVIVAARTMGSNELLLKQLVTDDLEPMLSVRVEIEPPPGTDIDVDSHAGIRQALELRPDYRQALLDLEQRHVTVAFQKNQVLPKLDLTASLGLLGLDSGFINSLSRFTKADKLTYSAGAMFSIPLGNHAARADLNSARLAAARSLVDLKRLEQQIVVEVDNAAGEVLSDRARIRSTHEAVRLARQSLDAGEEKLRIGTATTFEVLDLQKQLAETESAEIRAQADHNKAVAEFFRRTGSTLQRYRVQLR